MKKTSEQGNNIQANIIGRDCLGNDHVHTEAQGEGFIVNIVNDQVH